MRVYETLIKELDVYQIDIPPTKIYSAASIGKHALEQLGVKPFLEMNPDFPDPDYWKHDDFLFWGTNRM